MFGNMILKHFGIDKNSTLPEVLKTVNDNFDLGLDVQERPLTSDAAQGDLLNLAQTAQSVLASSSATKKFYRLEARPEGKPPVTAFIVVA